MPAPILATKLYIPPLRLHVVIRPRLVERLNEGLHRTLTLIAAPAGFGKPRWSVNGSRKSSDRLPGCRWTKEITTPPAF